MSRMAHFGHLLVTAVIIVTFIQVDAQSLSKESQAKISDIKEKLERSLSDKCKSFIPIAISLAKTDAQINNMCTILRGLKAVVVSKCSEEDYDKMSATICDEPGTTDKPTNSGLSKQSQAIINDINEKLQGSLSDNCSVYLNKSLQSASSDAKVYALCDNMLMPNAKNHIINHCEEEEYEKIKNSSCDAVKKAGVGKTEDKSGSGLSKESQAKISDIKEKLERSLSDKCKSFIPIAISLAKTDAQINNMCTILRGFKAVVVSKCSEEDYDKMLGIICDEPRTTDKPTNSGLSKQSQAIIKTVKEKLRKSVSNKCKPMVDFAASLAATDEFVNTMCDLVKGPIAKPIVTKKCEEKDYDIIVTTICETLHQSSNQTEKDVKQISEEAKLVKENIKNNITMKLQGACKDMALRKINDANDDDKIYSLCEDIKNDHVRTSFLMFCSADQYGEIKQLTCNEIHNAVGSHSKLSTEDDNECSDASGKTDATSADGLSKEASTVLATIKEKLEKAVSSKCTSLVGLATTRVTSDAKLINMCNSVRTRYKQLIIDSCSQEDYNKVAQVICEEMKGEIGQIHKTACVKVHTSDKPANSGLSKQSQAIINDIKEALQESLSDSCSAYLNKSLQSASSDAIVSALCDNMIMPAAKKHIINHCEEEEYEKIKNSSCNAVKKAGDKSGSGLSKESQAKISDIKDKLQESLSDKCKSFIPTAISMAKTDDQVKNMCTTLKGFKAVVVSKCSEDDYNKFVHIVCEEDDNECSDASGSKNATSADGLSKEASAVLATIKQKLEKAVSSKCTSLVGLATTRVTSDAKLINMCSSVRTTYKQLIIDSCSQEDYNKVAQVICEDMKSEISEIHKTACVKVQTSDKPAYNGMSKEGTKVLNAIKEKLKKVLSSKCQEMIPAAADLANTDIKLKGMCDSVQTGLKGTILGICSPDDYNKITKTVCDEIKLFVPQDGFGRLSKEGEKTLSIIKKDIGHISDKCNATLDKISNTDGKLMSLCQRLKGDLKNKTVENCADDVFIKLTESTCRETRKLGIFRVKRVIRISKVLYYYSDACKAQVGELPNLGTFDRIEDLCDDIKKNRKSDFENNCQGDQYKNLKQAVCTGAASLNLHSLAIILACVFISLFKILYI